MASRTDYTNRTIHLLCDYMNVGPRDAELIRLYAEPTQDAARWERFFATIDFEHEAFVFNCMLARLGARFNWQHVPETLVPRLKGVRKNLLVKNVALMARAFKLMKVIQDQGIPMLVMKGGALRLGYLPDIPQKMADIDVVVPQERYEECFNAIVAHGYDVPGFWAHSADIEDNGEGCVDLHFMMFKPNIHRSEPTDRIVERGTRMEKRGIAFTIPSVEDMFLQAMVNGADNYAMLDRAKGPLPWLADCIDLANRYPLSYRTIVDRAQEYGVTTHLQIAVAIMRLLIPNAFPELYSLVEGTVDARVYKRLKTNLKHFSVPKEEFARYSAPRHLKHVATLVYHKHVCAYHLGDPTPVVLATFPGYLWTRLHKYDRIDHLWELPGLVRKRAAVWRERNEGKGDHV